MLLLVFGTANTTLFYTSFDTSVYKPPLCSDDLPEVFDTSSLFSHACWLNHNVCWFDTHLSPALFELIAYFPRSKSIMWGISGESMGHKFELFIFLVDVYANPSMYHPRSDSRGWLLRSCTQFSLMTMGAAIHRQDLCLRWLMDPALGIVC